MLVNETRDQRKNSLLTLFAEFPLEFIGEQAIDNIHIMYLSAEELANAFCVEHASMDMKVCVGQCYSGTSGIMGFVSSVQTSVKKLVLHAVCIYVYDHCL